MQDTPFLPNHGIAEDLGDDIYRIVAPNPSPMTYTGTNTYIVGTGPFIVLDPGPNVEAHLAAIKDFVGDHGISHILVTHSHVDHSPLAATLSDAFNAPIYAFGTSADGISQIMHNVIASGYTGGGEGIDHAFSPDFTLCDGEDIHTPAGTFQAIHTPGHMGNHMCFARDGALFSGDHVMGWATSMVSPPDGDVGDFMRSCEKLLNSEWSRLLPGHGDVVLEANARISWLLAHRHEREAQVFDTLDTMGQTPLELAQKIYTDVDPKLIPIAARNVFAHLIELVAQNKVTALGPLSSEVKFTRK